MLELVVDTHAKGKVYFSSGKSVVFKTASSSKCQKFHHVKGFSRSSHTGPVLILIHEEHRFARWIIMVCLVLYACVIVCLSQDYKSTETLSHTFLFSFILERLIEVRFGIQREREKKALPELPLAERLLCLEVHSAKKAADLYHSSI